MQLYVLNLGRIECDLCWAISNPRPAVETNKTRPAMWVKMPVLGFLVVHPKGIILFDTGCAADGMSYWPEATKKAFPFYITEGEHLENRISALGINIRDIDTVILSHLHFDHAGNIRLFSHSRILVHSREFANALAQTHATPDYVGGYIKREFAIEGLHYDLIDEDTEIFPGIEVITLEGHTPGILGLVVHLKNSGTIICSSDALDTRANYGPPARLPGEIYDSLGFMRTVNKVRRLQRKYQALVIFGHDEQQYESELKKYPDYYE